MSGNSDRSTTGIAAKRALLLPMLLAACGGGGAGQQQAAPPPKVLVETVRAGAIPNLVELPGRIEAVRSVEIRARVDGIVERRLFTEGRDVAAGAALFTIDPRDMTAQRQQAAARLQTARVARSHAASIVGRFEPLVSRKAISAQEYDAALSSLRQADASVREAQAAVDRAQLQLDNTTVRAPIGGHIGRALVSEGGLVSAAAGTLMAQVDQLSPIFATFSQSSAELLELTQEIQAGRISVPDFRRVEVRLLKENGAEYGIVGYLDFAEQSVDPSTGGRILRARFDNPARVLLPGQFVRGVVTAGTIQGGITVPERAVQIGAADAAVFTVGADGAVVRRGVTLGGQTGGRWIVGSGLKAGERVIVDGWQRVQPGQKVDAQPAPPAAAASPAAAR
ncbi:MAG: efflux RND transporter periplasmic adaptor subunit [Sphingomonas sp.]|uniref:efflux RND transporter periplasmic adaptor subunit n=1 Tax=Sphingomonas sp. TaxID=28214 RepID=UPI0022736082|nr:efflux RND transporter periplasmic adaptor subunit [Sphingomonas sp.]MCX8475348.1 efflux RND transporter periplasmic adaptor subunit [Sphingomonas sp.]